MPHFRLRRLPALLPLLLLLACTGSPSTKPAPEAPGVLPGSIAGTNQMRLPNGWKLSPAGTGTPLGDLPLNLQISPDGRLAAVVNAGYSENSIQLLDAATVHAASRDVADLFALARDQAVASGMRTAVRLDAVRGRVLVHAAVDTIATLDLAQRSDVRITASRDSMAYAASGLGYGAANLRVILQRGLSADTVTVSRLGRVRR